MRTLFATSGARVYIKWQGKEPWNLPIYYISPGTVGMHFTISSANKPSVVKTTKGHGKEIEIYEPSDCGLKAVRTGLLYTVLMRWGFFLWQPVLKRGSEWYIAAHFISVEGFLESAAPARSPLAVHWASTPR